MRVTSARYANPEHTAVEATTDEFGSVILYEGSDDPERARAWLAALALGPAPYEAGPAFDPGVHIAWIEQALIEIGKLRAVEAAVAQDEATQALWRRVTTMRRTDPDVVAIGAALSIDLEALFARAEAIRKRKGAL